MGEVGAILADEIGELIARAQREINLQREEILRAFIAKYGWEPDECEQVLEMTESGGTRWYVRRKTK